MKELNKLNFLDRIRTDIYFPYVNASLWLWIESYYIHDIRRKYYNFIDFF